MNLLVPRFFRTFAAEDMKVYAFDFDGTLTTADTMLGLIRFARGRWGLWRCLLRYAPLLVLMRLGLYANWRCKELVLAYCFGGMTVADFDVLCRDYALRHRHLLRSDGMRLIAHALGEGHRVVVVSASAENWVRPFFTDDRILLTGTRLQEKDGRLTGRLLGRNCYGPEKVRRIEQLFPDRQDYTLVAYGDSCGDREMLQFADEAHYVRNGWI